MLKYLVIQLDDTSTSFCHYSTHKSKRRLIDLDTLRRGIIFAMKENLRIQFVFPDYKLPNEYFSEINSIDHAIIVSSQCKDADLKNKADIIVFNTWDEAYNCLLSTDKSYVLRTSKEELFHRSSELEYILKSVGRLNVIIKDIETFSPEDFIKYEEVLVQIIDIYLSCIKGSNIPQVNLVSDRMMLEKMNNCNAGWESVSLAPDGKFYICPAFYHTDCGAVGDLEEGINIRNSQLYKLDYAPICRQCDAFQCKRCVWLNFLTTKEVNTPSHEQCVIAHLERNASRSLMNKAEESGYSFTYKTIKEIDYLDPFDLIVKK